MVTTGPRVGSGTGVRDYVEDVRAAAAEFGEPPVLVGHSMGGLVVQKCLEDGEAAGAVLLAPPPRRGPLAAVGRLTARHPLAMLKVNLLWSLRPLVATDALVREMFYRPDTPAELVSRTGANLQDESYPAFLDILWRWPRPARVRAPVAVFGAELDSIITVKEIEGLAAAYGTQAEIFAGIGHNLMLDEGWQAVAERVHSWVRAVIAAERLRGRDALDAGADALARGDWARAREHFEASLAERESPEAWEGLGWAGYWLHDPELTIGARKRAYRGFRVGGDSGSAGRLAAWLAADFLEFRGDDAVGSGWLERARRLLDEAPPGADHGWLAVIEGSFAANVDGDLDRAAAAARRARRARPRVRGRRPRGDRARARGADAGRAGARERGHAPPRRGLGDRHRRGARAADLGWLGALLHDRGLRGRGGLRPRRASGAW